MPHARYQFIGYNCILLERVCTHTTKQIILQTGGTSLLSLRRAQTAISIYMTAIEISMTYRVGFLAKSALLNTKSQSIALGATTRLPEKVVKWLHRHSVTADVVPGPTYNKNKNDYINGHV
eukprot:GHVR01173591.1.p1 GENE.GHVR01173591.1~~GHVR01173591.1.p1  ORF type:complete len:121 (-),score=12.12 GHVR01173591.1:113-475(-)